MCRRRFNPASVASSDGNHVHLLHDRRANTTGRTPYTFCGKSVIITNDNVFCNGNWIGHLFIDDHGNKYVLGPHNKGRIDEIHP